MKKIEYTLYSGGILLKKIIIYEDEEKIIEDIRRVRNGIVGFKTKIRGTKYKV